MAFDYLDPDDISDEYLLKLRIVRVEVSDGVFENIITTLSEEDFTPDDIKYCYNLRWGIETSFRDLKHTIGATNLHSKKTEYVAFELWSKLILYNFCSIIILHVPVKSIRYPHGLSNRTLFLLLFLSHTDNKCINFWIFFFHMFVQHMTPLPKTFREFRMFSCNSLIHLPTMRLKMCCNRLLILA